MQLTLNVLKQLSSEEAAKLIIENYPIHSEYYYRAFDLIKSFSWKKKDRQILARYYLNKIPFATSKPYECFLQVMPLKELLMIIKEIQIVDDEKNNLLKYHLETILKNKNLNDMDFNLLNNFINNQQA